MLLPTALDVTGSIRCSFGVTRSETSQEGQAQAKGEQIFNMNKIRDYLQQKTQLFRTDKIRDYFQKETQLFYMIKIRDYFQKKVTGTSSSVWPVWSTTTLTALPCRSGDGNSHQLHAQPVRSATTLPALPPSRGTSGDGTSNQLCALQAVRQTATPTALPSKGNDGTSLQPRSQQEATTQMLTQTMTTSSSA
jgi:hypothetical protein